MHPAGGDPFPLRVASVDTGSNAIRFFAAEFYSPTRYHPLYYERVPIRLGHQVFLNGRLARSTMDATVLAFREFREHLDRLGIEHFRAVATSAVREALNGDELVARIDKEADIRLETVSGSEEARLVHAAVASRIDLSAGKWILVDVGGGSVEVSLVDEVGMLWAESHTMGSVRLLEELSVAGDDPGRFRRLIADYVSVLKLPTPAQYFQLSGLIATGGNIEALAELAAAAPGDNGVSRLPLSDVKSAIGLLSRLSFREKVQELQLREDRADVILPAAIVYLRVAELAGVDEFQVPHVGVKEGIVLDLVDELLSHEGHGARQEKQLISASLTLGRRFLFDEAHGVKVAELGDSLFRQLRSLHGLKEHDRRLLKVAALLHDIGLFISYKKHHRHSLYVLSRSELPGLTPSDMNIVANVARYHRKRGPSHDHPEYMGLAHADRMRVTQLSALLRLADALDRQHEGVVESVRAAVGGMDLELNITGEGDLLLERWAVSRKADVFEEAFGLRVRVTT